MRAIVYDKPQPISAENALFETDLPVPVPTGRDLRVAVKAVSVNPVDVKLRAAAPPQGAPVRVLGFDAAGVVEAVGPEVTLFRPGDEVFYAGSIARAGSNAEFHCVDERIVGRKPRTLSFAEAAALPLTAITGYEALLHRLRLADPVPGAAHALVVIGGAGGVGSIAIQIARALSDVTVIATASRPETAEWVKAMGAHHVIDHSQPLAPQIAALGLGEPGFVLATTEAARYIPDIAAFIAPQGRLAMIVESEGLSIQPLMRKSVSVHWEMMFTRSLFQTADMEAQHHLLNHVADLIDAGRLCTTLTETLRPISAATLMQAHQRVESGRMIGKIVVEGFGAG